MKIVINKCYGGFSISKEAAQYMADKGHKQAAEELSESTKDKFYGYGYTENFKGGYNRADPLLVEVVETLGEKANNTLSDLKVIDIPDHISWYIYDYDGIEEIHEEHESWG